jgi:hypothetical protein
MLSNVGGCSASTQVDSGRMTGCLFTMASSSAEQPLYVDDARERPQRGEDGEHQRRIAEATFLGDQTQLRLVAFGADDFIMNLANTARQDSFGPGMEIDIGWQTKSCRALAE